MKRQRIAAALALPVLALSGCTTATTDTASPPTTTTPQQAPAIDTARLDQRMAALEQQYSAKIGLAVLRPSDRAQYAHRGDERFAHCSTFKVYAVAALLRLVDAGKASLDTRILIDPAAVVADSPVTSKAAGTEMTLSDISVAALTQSDNTAGNYLLHAIGGPSAITDFARSVGDTETRGDRFEVELNTAIPDDPRDTSTPVSLATGFETTILGDGLPAADRTRLQEWMRQSATSTARIRAGLPAGWTSADKTGAGDYGTVNDAGVVWNPAGEPLVLTILTRSSTDRQDAQRDNKLIADITAAAVETFDAGR